MLATLSKKYLDPLNLNIEDVNVDDIAHSLALINRFAGHTREPISVAQHSVFVSKLAFQHTQDRTIGLQGLLHDASEYVLGDVTKWLKHTPYFDKYRELEERIQEQIYKKFGCPTRTHAVVERFDKLMVRFEGLMGYGWHIFKRIDYPPIGQEDKDMIGPWDFWPWDVAEQAFLRQFHDMTLHPLQPVV